MNRFRRIKDEFGAGALARTALLLAALPAMVLLDYLAFSSLAAGLIAAAGLALGFLLRRYIPAGVDHYQRLFTFVLFTYPVVLFVGDRLGLGRSAQLAVITAVTTLIFDLQFWSLSDPSVENASRRRRA